MDEIDIANKRAEEELDHSIRQRSEAAQRIPKGVPGDCDLCGEWSGRLVGGACAPCRDRHNLP